MRDASHRGAGGHIPCHNRVGSDRRSVPDRHPPSDNRPSSDPHVGADLDGGDLERLTIVRWPMILGVDRYVLADECSGPDRQQRVRDQRDVLADEYALTDVHAR